MMMIVGSTFAGQFASLLAKRGRLLTQYLAAVDEQELELSRTAVLKHTTDSETAA
jgi:hypothetical protein